jgi:hypothetical protein
VRRSTLLTAAWAPRVLTAAAASVALVGSGSLGAHAGHDREPAEVSQSDWPIVVVRHVSGLRLAGVGLRPLPSFYVSGDGRLVTLSPRIAVYPGPALPNLRVQQLSKTGIQALRGLAVEAGLAGRPPDYGRPPQTGRPEVADATTTEVVYRAATGRTYSHRAYALGLRAGLGTAETEPRQRLRRFIDRLASPAEALGAENVGPDLQYRIPAFEIVARATPPLDELPQTFATAWPVRSIRLAQAGRCTPVTGPDADLLERALRNASVMTRWIGDGRPYLLSARPVLPDEAPCL